jgi:GTPase
VRYRCERVKFVDSCEVRVVGGNGGDGCIAFRREKYVPRGGPSGGDGGNGGDVVFVGDDGKMTLLDVALSRVLRAEHGENGRGKDQYGAAGADLIVNVPLGTQGFDVDTDEQLFDIDAPGRPVVVARGGRGGRGNIHFATPYDRAPRRAEAGTSGEDKTLRLELKVMADVGLLGFPNVGKSTFVSAVSRARPKVADYPFTTLVPHLGVVSLGEDSTFVLADVPGLIPGAAQGAGLGVRFLKHVERTRALLHLVTVDPSPGREPLADFDAINEELSEFDPQLARRPQVVAMSKGDLPEVRAAWADAKSRFARRGIDLCLVSAATGEGVGDVLAALWRILRSSRSAAAASTQSGSEEAQ